MSQRRRRRKSQRIRDMNNTNRRGWGLLRGYNNILREEEEEWVINSQLQK
jgi:hypothetical protein